MLYRDFVKLKKGDVVDFRTFDKRFNAISVRATVESIDARDEIIYMNRTENDVPLCYIGHYKEVSLSDPCRL